jgi:hypothetical protein
MNRTELYNDRGLDGKIKASSGDNCLTAILKQGLELDNQRESEAEAEFLDQTKYIGSRSVR